MFSCVGLWEWDLGYGDGLWGEWEWMWEEWEGDWDFGVWGVEAVI